MDLQSDFNNELEEHVEDEDPMWGVHLRQDVPSVGHPETDHDRWNGEDVCDHGNQEMDPVVDRTVSVVISTPTERDERLQMIREFLRDVDSVANTSC